MMVKGYSFAFFLSDIILHLHLFSDMIASLYVQNKHLCSMSVEQCEIRPVGEWHLCLLKGTI